MKIGAMIRWDLMLIPIATERVKIVSATGYSGYIYFYIFGIRVAKIQATNPWQGA
jgi:hypothetical protein